MEVKLEFLRRVQVVEDHEAARWLLMSNLSEVDALGREGSHRAIIVEVSTTNWQVFIELDFIRLLLLEVVACAAKAKSVGFNRRTFDVANLDRKVKGILFGLERAEESENVTNLVRAESTLRVRDFEDSEIMVILIKLLHTAHIDLVLQLGNAEVLDLDRVCDSPLESDRYRGQVVSVLDKLELGTAMECLALESDS